MPQVLNLDRSGNAARAAVDHRIDVPFETPPPPATAFTTKPPGDPLLDCLQFFSKLLTKAVSADALRAGLPLVDNRLTPELFNRAAGRAGLTAKVAKQPLGSIPAFALPAVLLLEDGDAVIMLKRPRGGRVRVLVPRSGSGQRRVKMSDLLPRYSGVAILVSRAYRFEARTANAGLPDTNHWFRDAFAKTWGIYSEVILASLLINIFALVTPLFSMSVYDRVVPNRVMETLWVLAIGAGIVVLFDFMMRTLRGYFIDIAGKRIDTALSSSIFERVIGLEMSARPPSVGAFASRLQDFESVREFITSATISTLIDLPFALIFIGVVFWIGGPLGWVLVAAVPIIIALSLIIQAPLSRVVKESSRMSSQRQATLIESLSGLETIKVMGAEGIIQRKWEEVAHAIANHGLKARFLSSIAVNFATFAQQAAYIAIIVYGVYLIGDDKLSVGGLIACSLLTGRALAPLGQVAALLTRFHQSHTAVSSIDGLMKLPIERPLGREFVERPRLRGMVEFRNVCFAYPKAKTDALVNVSFRINPGERVALIGRIGSGKTTIEKLILGLYAPADGAVLLDGVDVRQLDPLAIRRDIGHVPQEPMLFYGSVRDNITMGAPFAEDGDVLRAAEIAGVAGFIDRMPNGYDLQVGERGEMLSGGQRQAIAIARAELLVPPILLLDEPTSAMDSRSEELFKSRLGLQLAGRTLIVVTHRPSILSLVHRVIVLDQGRVVADGPKEKVLAALAAGSIKVTTS